MRLAPAEIPRYAAGYVLVTAALLLLLALVSYHPLDPSWFTAGSDRTHNWLGSVGAWVAGVLIGLFGVLSLLFVFVLARIGWRWLAGERLEGGGGGALCLAVTLVLGGALLSGLAGSVPYRGGKLEVGGALGGLAFRGLSASFGEPGALLVAFLGALAGVIFGLRRAPLAVARRLQESFHRSLVNSRARWRRLRERRQRRKLERKLLREQRARQRRPEPALLWQPAETPGFCIHRLAAPPGAPPRPRPASQQVAVAPAPVLPEVVEESSSGARQRAFAFLVDTPPSVLPELNLLAPPAPVPPPNPQQLEQMRQMLEEKFREFKVEGRVEGVTPGPVITTFEFQPAPGVKYAQVVRLEEDLALKLGVEAVRLERIPGKASVGVEVPNPERQTIVLREIVESSRFVNAPSPLTLALGKDIRGVPVVADLARMPHLLIGGFTGSGKSVGINAMIMP
ncbi:MAG: DNA translocase FtsK 4TM domain-containing protein, partial [Thermoanaerobaculum sp.]|nr:DNA translocase FtsK 4TM domain-containing protein [Thermoanaerobaculum sp.]